MMQFKNRSKWSSTSDISFSYHDIYLIHGLYKGCHNHWEDLVAAWLLGKLANVEQVYAFIGE